jgi:hypothetical protein
VGEGRGCDDFSTVTLELLTWLAAPCEALLAGLDPEAEDVTVSWAGAGPHPNWLDVAREYTERWVHQQQIRQAVVRPGLEQCEYAEPVVDTFVRALPAVLPPRPAGTQVQLRVTSPFEPNGRSRRSRGDGALQRPLLSRLRSWQPPLTQYGVERCACLTGTKPLPFPRRRR